jgi:hypothetical protein
VIGFRNKKLMVRDKFRDDKHFLAQIERLTKSHERRMEKITLGQIKPDRMAVVKQSMATNLIQKTVAKYSLGLSPMELTNDFDTIIDLIDESWSEGKRKLTGSKNKPLDQYVINAHVELLDLLSIAYLTVLPVTFFQRLDKIISNDQVIDLIFELILSSRLINREIKQEKEGYGFKLYQNLKEAIKSKEKVEAENLVKLFLEKDWLREQQMAQMLTDPKKESYSGRWSFESAAVTCILGLDDSSYRDNQYYPKDLVDYYRENHIN